MKDIICSMSGLRNYLKDEDYKTAVTSGNLIQEPCGIYFYYFFDFINKLKIFICKKLVCSFVSKNYSLKKYSVRLGLVIFGYPNPKRS